MYPKAKNVDYARTGQRTLGIYLLLFRLRYDTFLEPDITKLPHPRGVLQFIKSTRVYNLLRPPEPDTE